MLYRRFVFLHPPVGSTHVQPEPSFVVTPTPILWQVICGTYHRVIFRQALLDSGSGFATQVFVIECLAFDGFPVARTGSAMTERDLVEIQVEQTLLHGDQFIQWPARHFP